jgi:hypothetical protein
LTLEKFQQSRLSAYLTLIHDSHANMNNKIPVQLHGKINAIMFNLGYLPGADKSVITQVKSTLIALTIASRILADNGIITVLAYPGHQGGDLETHQVENWCSRLDSRQFEINTIHSPGLNHSAPRLFIIRRHSIAMKGCIGSAIE